MNALTDFLITLFESLGLYSTRNGLGEHLKGLDIKCNDYSNQSIYAIIFISLFAINSLIIINYYYGIFNRVPFNRFLWWLGNVLSGSVILFAMAFIFSNSDFASGNYCKQLQITKSDCIGFSITASVFSILWCILLSALIKWKSINNKKVPF